MMESGEATGMEEQVRCKLCGSSPEGDPEFPIRYYQHREKEKARRVTGPMIYICPRCLGRTQYEANEQLKKKPEM
jgi:DNA-directed RNA polymerase subunit RPC12/RpoP